jgi:hypothetical protein
MNNLVKVAFGALLVSSLGGCAMAAGGDTSVSGTIYSGYKTGGAIGSGAAAAKTGESCASSILGIIATGDASVAAAKSAGGIQQVSHVDHDVFSVLGIYAKSCTVVSGQ